MKLVCVFVVLVSANAFAGGVDFDSYLNANAHNPALNKKTRNQEAFASESTYYSGQDPKLGEYKGKGAFKLGGSSGSSSFSGSSSGAGGGAGAFKPSAVTAKPVTLAPSTAPAQTSNSQEPDFGTRGVTPSASNASAGGASGSTSQSSVGGSGGASASNPSACARGAGPGGILLQNCSAGQNSDPYVSGADQMAQRQYDASQEAYRAQQAAMGAGRK